MRCFKGRPGLLALAASCSAGVAGVRAADATSVLVHSFGPFHLKPHLSVAARYDDNIFYRPDEPVPGYLYQPIEDDFITIVSPGVSLQLGRKEANVVLFDYRYDQSFYLEHSDQNGGDHNFTLASKLDWNRITVEGADRFQFLTGILGGSSNLGERVDRFTYFDNYTVEYTVGEKTALYVEGLFDAVDYETGTPLYDSNTLRGTGGFLFKPTTRLSVFGELYYGQAAVDPNVSTGPLSVKGPHQEFLGGFAGVRGDFTTRLSGMVKAGYETSTFSDDTLAPSSPVVEASLQHQLSEKISASLNYSRRINVSVQTAGLAYTADIIGVRLTQVLNSSGKLVGSVGGTFENDNFEATGSGPRRHDTWIRMGAELNYNIQLWLTAGLSYEFESYRSNEVIDYDVNRVTLKISVGY